MLDQMRKTINRNLLKYSAGNHIFCPRCGNVADYRRWLIVEDESGKTVWQGCTDCAWATFDDMPGYNVIRETTKEKKAPKFSTEFSVVDANGGKHIFPADLAFSMFGNKFYLHPRMGNDGKPSVKAGFTVSCQNGAAVCYGKTKAGTIREAKQKLEIIGENGFKMALESCRH